MGELKVNKILNMKFINQETGEVIVTYSEEKTEELKEFVDFEPIIAEDDYLGQWRQDTVEWLLKHLDVGE